MSLTSFQDDTRLLKQLAQDDESAFTALYHQYWKPLYFLAHRHLKSSTAAEEVVQDVFMMLWIKRKELVIASPAAYFAAMTRFAVYRYLAKQKKRQQKEMQWSKTVSSFIEEEHHIDNRILLEIVEKFSNQLPEKCRLVFIHNKLLDQPLQEVAEELNISLKTAEAHLTKALKVIRGNLSDPAVLGQFLLLYLMQK